MNISHFDSACEGRFFDGVFGLEGRSSFEFAESLARFETFMAIVLVMIRDGFIVFDVAVG